MNKGFIVLIGLILSACSVQQFDGERKADPVAGARTRVAIAIEYLQKNQLDLALQHLQRALELDPKSPEAYNIMGVLLEKDDNFSQAESNYRKSLSLKSDYPQARNNYGVLLFRLKRYKDAIEQFSIAANDLSYERREVALDYVIKIALQINDLALAKSSLERLLRITPLEPEPALMLADLMYKDKNYDEANRYYQRYLRNLAKNPQSSKSLLLGIRLAQQKKDLNTIASYELVLRKLYPQSAEYQEYLKNQP